MSVVIKKQVSFDIQTHGKNGIRLNTNKNSVKFKLLTPDNFVSRNISR